MNSTVSWIRVQDLIERETEHQHGLSLLPDSVAASHAPTTKLSTAGWIRASQTLSQQIFPSITCFGSRILPQQKQSITNTEKLAPAGICVTARPYHL